MPHTRYRFAFAFLAIATLAAAGLHTQPVQAGNHGKGGKRAGTMRSDDLFYNYYVDYPGGVPAQLYTSPRPTPPLVGHTYITYQPLMPHEFLYVHNRTYNAQFADGSSTTTRIKYGFRGENQKGPHVIPRRPRPVPFLGPRRFWSQ